MGVQVNDEKQDAIKQRVRDIEGAVNDWETAAIRHAEARREASRAETALRNAENAAGKALTPHDAKPGESHVAYLTSHGAIRVTVGDHDYKLEKLKSTRLK
jgi:hypothetical protein